MSDYETHKGKLEKIDKNIDELFDELIDNGLKISSFYKKPYDSKTKKEIIMYEVKNYIITSDEIFKIIETPINDYEDIFEIDKDNNFLVRFYNGGMSFQEALTIALKKRKKERNKK